MARLPYLEFSTYLATDSFIRKILLASPSFEIQIDIQIDRTGVDISGEAGEAVKKNYFSALKGGAIKMILDVDIDQKALNSLRNSIKNSLPPRVVAYTSLISSDKICICVTFIGKKDVIAKQAGLLYHYTHQTLRKHDKICKYDSAFDMFKEQVDLAGAGSMVVRGQ